MDSELSEDEIKEVFRGPSGINFEIIEMLRLEWKLTEKETKEVKLVLNQLVL